MMNFQGTETTLIEKSSTCKETSILLPSGSQIDKNKKYGGGLLFCVLVSFVLMGVLMIKWHVISQSVITPSSHEEIDVNGAPAQPGSEQAESPKEDSQEDVDPDWGRIGATAVQLGKAFPLTILAEIAFKDVSNMIFGNNYFNKNVLAQSNSMIPSYVSDQDCNYAINYFENSVSLGKTGFENVFGHGGADRDRDCQYVDLSNLSDLTDANDDTDSNSCELGKDRMLMISERIKDYFFGHYSNYLKDCDVSDIRMIKYVENGSGYSGLHAETHHIDGRPMVIGDGERQADFVGVVFLNDDFKGGELEFIAPKAINSIVPKIGNGVLFGGGLDYAHRVGPVKNGNRYVLKMIFTRKL